MSDDPQNYSNLALANLRGNYPEAIIDFYDESGKKIGYNEPLFARFNPWGTVSFVNVLQRAGHDVVADGPISAYRAQIEVRIPNDASADAAVLPYASVIDRSSRDPVLIAPATGELAASYRLAGVLRAAGANDTLWRSDVILFNPESEMIDIALTFSYEIKGSRKESREILTLGPRQMRVWRDFVKEFLNLADSDRETYANSFLDIETTVDANHPNGHPLAVLAKTYNVTQNGKVGLSVQGFRTQDGASGTAGANKALVLTGLRSTSDYRSNVAIFYADPSKRLPGEVGATVRVFDALGQEIASQGLGLRSARPFAQLSIDSLVKDKSGDLSSLSVVIDSISGTDAIAAYSTVIDNKTGDATLDKAESMP